MVDFRTAKPTVSSVIAELRAEDPNCGWKADVLKGEIRVWWGYLQYCGNVGDHFTVKLSDRPEESLTEDFVVVRNEHNEYIHGAILGNESYADGDLNKCVEILLRTLASHAHSCY